MTIRYPTNIDDLLTVPKVTDLVTPVRAAEHNIVVDAILAIETELGANPSGTAGTVADRLDDLEDTVSGDIAATQITVADVGNNFAATTVESALAELSDRIESESFTASSIPIVDSEGNFATADVEHALAELADGYVKIGPAEDGSYSDGLFDDLTSNTRLGVAIDRFNEILSNVVPSPAPDLSSIGFSTTLGPAGKLSFGASNAIVGYTNVGTAGGGSALDINDIFTSGSGTALRKGIYASGVAKTGALADTVVADSSTPNPSYPAKAFGNGDTGTLELFLNGSMIHSVNLASFASGSSVNGNGSGFTSLSTATSVVFPNGTSFSTFKYRTGNWIVSSTEPQNNGWNFIQVKHVASSTLTTNFFEWVVDANATATSFSAASLAAPTMAGTKNISGVKYHTSGSATYSITISNHHRNTYSSSSSAITHPGASNVSIASTSINSAVTEATTQAVSQTATINASRLLNGSISVDTAVDRTVQSDITSSASTRSNLLMDAVSDDATATNETLNGELFRVPSDRSLSLTTGFTLGGAALWDGTISIGGATSGYSDGLLVHGGSLFYPSSSSVANSGNFSGISSGPGGNVNYSAVTGTRTYWRYFFFSSATQNFILSIVSSGCSFIAVSSSLGTNNGNVHVEMLLPATTVNGSSTVEFKDAVTAYTADTAIGCFAASVGATIPTNWGLTAGSKSTATSGSAVILRITVGQGWTGSIDNISMVGA